MKAPNKIYVNIPYDYWHPGTDKKVDTDTEYLRKDALLEWAKEELSKASVSSSSIGRRNAFIDVIDKLNSM